MNRILLFVSVAVSTFVVGLWAARGFPMRSPFAQTRPPAPVLVDSTFGDGKFEKLEQQRTEQAQADPDNAKRNPLRMDTLQAATGYALSPCDAGMKANLIKATTAYAAGYRWRDKCNPMFGNCDAVLERANVMYSSPLDKRVRAALREAFDKGGISKNDFPPNLQIEVMALAGGVPMPAPFSACERSTAAMPR